MTWPASTLRARHRSCSKQLLSEGDSLSKDHDEKVLAAIMKIESNADTPGPVLCHRESNP
jgi:hypothetical protein